MSLRALYAPPSLPPHSAKKPGRFLPPSRGYEVADHDRSAQHRQRCENASQDDQTSLKARRPVAGDGAEEDQGGEERIGTPDDSLWYFHITSRVCLALPAGDTSSCNSNQPVGGTAGSAADQARDRREGEGASHVRVYRQPESFRAVSSRGESANQSIKATSGPLL